ncbi:MAG: alpha/beta hydrolase domain-containing protein [Vicinamibacterales bacterium]
MRILASVVLSLTVGVLAAASPLAAQSAPFNQGPRVTGPVSGGSKGRQFRSFAVDGADLLTPAGYVEEEFFVDGEARSYEATSPLTSDGRWSVVAAPGTSAYRTRLVVRRPRDGKRFNGVVLVEWLNVTAGFDLDPDFVYASTELLRGGYAWVGVSAQRVSVTGGMPPGFGLKTWDPERYGTLVHPGDSYAYDIFSQAGVAVRASTGTRLLGPLRPRRVIADGESQSAGFMVTYVNAVHPLAQVFDGFMIHSRSARSAPLSQAPQAVVPTPAPVRIRTDLATPVFVVQSETDVPGSLDARQADSDRFRLWEIAGTAHVDQYMSDLSNPVTQRDLPTFPGFPCARPYNNGPHHWVFKAAVRALDRWIADRVAPPKAGRLEILPGPPPEIVRDAHGNARGGVRTPHVDVPVATISGSGNSPALCALFGTTAPLNAQALAALYPQDEFRARFDAATDQAVRAGFLLTADAADVKAGAVLPR